MMVHAIKDKSVKRLSGSKREPERNPRNQSLCKSNQKLNRFSTMEYYSAKMKSGTEAFIGKWI